MSPRKYGWIIALLGVVIGILATSLYYRIHPVIRHFDGDYNRWRKLNLILREVERNYVDTLDREGMTDAAVVAALGRLDPHSVYLPPVELKESETDLAGNFDGIGIQFNVPNDTAVVIEVIAGGPSEKAGLLAGDRILQVDDKVIAGVKFPQDSMVRRMRGPAGTKVRLRINREGTQIPFEITRGKIPTHSIDAAFMLDDSTGYVRLSKFSATTYQEFLQAAARLSDQGMRRLVFDLRDNSGGYFDQSIYLCNEFLHKKDPLVYIEGLHRRREDYDSDGQGRYQGLPLCVLINENSASSSEIFAGAIQDNDRGVIIGRRSFGKGLVQEPVHFTDGSGLRLTVARYHTPSGRCIQKPYAKDAEYGYDLYRRYSSGELFSADSIKVDSTLRYATVHGRTVYGGGGIVPDVFIPMDTTRATAFYVSCNRKATQVRYASAFFDRNRARLAAISDFDSLVRFLDEAGIPDGFRSFAAQKDGLRTDDAQWQETLPYLEPQLRALVGRYSRLGDEAFYRLYLPMDEMMKTALAGPFRVGELSR